MGHRAGSRRLEGAGSPVAPGSMASQQQASRTPALLGLAYVHLSGPGGQERPSPGGPSPSSMAPPPHATASNPTLFHLLTWPQGSGHFCRCQLGVPPMHLCAYSPPAPRQASPPTEALQMKSLGTGFLFSNWTQAGLAVALVLNARHSAEQLGSENWRTRFFYWLDPGMSESLKRWLCRSIPWPPSLSCLSWLFTPEL